MRKMIISIIALITVFAATSQAHSTDRVLAGTLIGAGSGALIGQAIGGDTESTILGTAIGGIVGFTAGSLHHPGHVSSSLHIGYNTSYPGDYHRHYKGYRNYYPRHHNYYHQRHHYKKSRYYENNHHYTPRNKIIIKNVYKNVNHYKVNKHYNKKDRFEGHRFHRDHGKHSSRHYGNHREKRSHRR